jgi:hypothetical protein
MRTVCVKMPEEGLVCGRYTVNMSSWVRAALWVGAENSWLRRVTCSRFSQEPVFLAETRSCSVSPTTLRWHPSCVGPW